MIIIFSAIVLFVHKIFVGKFVSSAIFALWHQDDARIIKNRNSERQISGNGKLQYLSQSTTQESFLCRQNEH